MLRILAFLLFTTFGLAPHPLAAEADILLHDGARYHPSVVSGAALGVAPPEGAGACRREPGWTRSAAPEMPRQLASGRVVGLTAVEADWRDVGRLYALGQESLYTTLDCGQNWRAIPS